MSVKVTFLESTEIGGQRSRQLGDSFLFDITEDDKIGTFNILFCRIVAEERLTEALSSRAVLYFTVENSKEANNILKAIALASDSWIGCDKCPTWACHRKKCRDALLEHEKSCVIVLQLYDYFRVECAVSVLDI